MDYVKNRKKSVSLIRTRYQESDQMGLIHHSSHIIWFEIGRIELFKNHGISIRDLEKEGILFPVLKIEAKYIAPVFFDEEIEVHAFIKHFSKYRIGIENKILAQKEKLICKGSSEHTFVHKKDYKPIPVPGFVQQQLEKKDIPNVN